MSTSMRSSGSDRAEQVSPKEKLRRLEVFRDEVIGWLKGGVEIEVNHGHPGSSEATVKVPDNVESAIHDVDGL